MLRGQAEELMPMIVRVMDKAGIPFGRIDRIVTTVGPGAFTGLRLGLSAARAMGLALGRPVTGLSTFAVLAAQYRADHPGASGALAVILETKRQDFYYQIVDASDGGAITPPGAGAEAAVTDAIRDAGAEILIGDALARFPCEGGMKVEGYGLTDPGVMARLALDPAFQLPPEPLYLRDADVSKPKRAAREIIGG